MSRGALGAGLAAALLLPGTSLAASALLGLLGPAGSDPDIWLLSALDVPARLPLYFPPLYPAAVAALQAATPLHLVEAGYALALASRALVGLALAAAARRSGAGPAALAVVLVICCFAPDLVGMGLRVGPDGLAAAVLAGLAVACLGPRGGHPLALGLGLLAACLVREVGLVSTALVGAAAVVGPGLPAAHRRAVVATLAAVLLLVPVVAGAGLETPWAWPWLHRVVAGSVAAGSGLDIPREVPAWARELATHGSVGVLVAQAAWATTQAPGSWLLVAIGAAGALRTRRWTLLALLLSSTAALATWSAPRHVAVFVPAALVAVLATAPAGATRRWLLATALAGLATLPTWPARGDLLLDEAHGISRLRDLGEELCALVQPGDLAAGEPRAFLFCPLPRTDLAKRTEEAQWHAWVAGTKPAGRDWGKVQLEADAFDIYRYGPGLVGDARPCGRSRPSRETRFFEARGGTVARMSPPCYAPTEDPTEGNRLRHLREGRPPPDRSE